MPKRSEIYSRSAGSDKIDNDSRNASDSSFYKSYKWQKFREGLLKDRFARDVAYILRNMKKLDINVRAFERWKNSGLPYCKITFEETGELVPGRVADHIIPFESADSRRGKESLKWKRDNIQFLSDQAHAVKSAKDKQYYNLDT